MAFNRSRKNNPPNRSREDKGKKNKRSSSSAKRFADRASRSRGGFGDSNRSGNRSFSRGGNDRDRDFKPLIKVECDECGKTCEVPFKPTGDKPVYCSVCFRTKSKSSKDSNNERSSSSNSVDLKEINAKLDKIIRLLER